MTELHVYVHDGEKPFAALVRYAVEEAIESNVTTREFLAEVRSQWEQVMDDEKRAAMTALRGGW